MRFLPGGAVPWFGLGGGANGGAKVEVPQPIFCRGCLWCFRRKNKRTIEPIVRPRWFVRLSGSHSCDLGCCFFVWRPVKNWRLAELLFVFAFLLKPLPPGWWIRAILPWRILPGGWLWREYGLNPLSRVSLHIYFKIERASGRWPQRYKLRYLFGPGELYFLEISWNLL